MIALFPKACSEITSFNEHVQLSHSFNEHVQRSPLLMGMFSAVVCRHVKLFYSSNSAECCVWNNITSLIMGACEYIDTIDNKMVAPCPAAATLAPDS